MRALLMSSTWRPWLAVGALSVWLGAGCDLSQPPKAYRPSGAGAAQDGDAPAGGPSAPPAAPAADSAATTGTQAAGTQPQTKPVLADGAPAPAARLPVRRNLQVMSPDRINSLKPLPLPASARVPVLLEKPADAPAAPAAPPTATTP